MRLPPGEQRVAHRLLEPRGAGLGGEAQALEVVVDLVLELDRVEPARLHACAQRRRSWPSASPAARLRASMLRAEPRASSAQRSTSSAASSASIASERSLSGHRLELG